MKKQEIIESIKKDPNFNKLKHLFEAPNMFRITNMGFTETWHSAFWSWLFNPNGSHELEMEPLSLLLQLIDEEIILPNKGSICVWPDENGKPEKSFNKKGFKKCELDTYIEIGNEKKSSIVIEYKIESSIDIQQMERYIEVLEGQTNAIFVYVVPITEKEKLLVAHNSLKEDCKKWHCLTYQELYEKILLPIIEINKNNFNPFENSGMVLIADYIKNLRGFIVNKNIRIAYTKEEEEHAVLLYRNQERIFTELQGMFEEEVVRTPYKKDGSIREPFFNSEDTDMFNVISDILFHKGIKTPENKIPYFKEKYRIDYNGETIIENSYIDVYIKLLKYLEKDNLIELLFCGKDEFFYGKKKNKNATISKKHDNNNSYERIGNNPNFYYVNKKYGIKQLNTIITEIETIINQPKRRIIIKKVLWPA